MHTYHRLGFLIVLPTLCLAVGCTSGPKEPSLDAVRIVAEKYRDVIVAKREGYTTDNKCTTAEMLGFPAEMGAMGLHYVRRDLLGLPPKPPPGSGRVHGTGTHSDFTKPAMLVYEPQQDGSLKLVAVENLVFASAWQAAGKKGPPTFHGQPYVLLTDKPETYGLPNTQNAVLPSRNNRRGYLGSLVTAVVGVLGAVVAFRSRGAGAVEG